MSNVSKLRLFNTLYLIFKISIQDFFCYFVFLIVPLLLSIAFFTLAERKGMASIQRRIGPNSLGFWGVLQPFADGLKLLLKELIIPTKSSKVLFVFCPFLCLFFSFISWFSIVLNPFVITSFLNFGILYNLIISSLSVYCIFLAGWTSNSKYAIIGSIRGISQLIAYEIPLTVILIPLILVSGSMNYGYIIFNQLIITWNIFFLFPISFCFLICAFAETNRIPFDLVEAEAELIAGYNVEYSGFLFAMFFLSEYGFMILMCMLYTIFFLGGGDFMFFSLGYPGNNIYSYTLLYDFIISLKTMGLSFFFIFIRANLPRYRFDQLLCVGWRVMLPISIGFLVFYSSILFVLSSFFILETPCASLGYKYSFGFASIV